MTPLQCRLCKIYLAIDASASGGKTEKRKNGKAERKTLTGLRGNLTGLKYLSGF
jgi:hypothetical protein